MTRRILTMVLALAAAGASGAACAGLGEAATSVAHDRGVLEADQVATTAMPAYDRHELTTVDGVRVAEFSAHGTGGADGPVFAVRFEGPTLPDLRTVLGAQYDRYVAAAGVQQRRAHNRHFMTFDDDGFVVTIVKLPRGFTGSAHLRALVPAGVDVQELR